MFQASTCPSSGVQLVTSAFGSHTWKAAWVVWRWAAMGVHCSEDVARQAAFQVWPRKAQLTNSTPDDGHVWCPKHVEAIKLHILSHLVGSLHFTVSSMQSNEHQNTVRLTTI
jgi:hypothetical protein